MAESAKISIDTQDFESCYKRMASSHLDQSKDSRKKQRRVFDTYWQEQLQAVYKAWYDHSIAIITPQSKTSLYEYYFTMPFFLY